MFTVGYTLSLFPIYVGGNRLKGVKQFAQGQTAI